MRVSEGGGGENAEKEELCGCFCECAVVGSKLKKETFDSGAAVVVVVVVVVVAFRRLGVRTAYPRGACVCISSAKKTARMVCRPSFPAGGRVGVCILLSISPFAYLASSLPPSPFVKLRSWKERESTVGRA